MNRDVIFLINSDLYDKDILGLTLERITKCRVFNFFSFEETLLYKHLSPKLILHNDSQVDQSYFEGNVSFYNLAPKANPKVDTSEFALSLASDLKALI